jgi:alanine dehydrogenase
MKIGILNEIRVHENRVLLIPEDVKALVKDGNQVYVEKDAGVDSNFIDTDYEEAGATILPSSEKIFQKTNFILKVLPPRPIDYEMFTENHIAFCFLSLANNPERLQKFLKCNSIFFSAELIKTNDDVCPVLAPMSEIAGKLSIMKAAKYLQKPAGGKGISIFPIMGLLPATVTVVGAGVAGSAAASFALQNGAIVNLLDIDIHKAESLSKKLNNDNLHIFEYSKSIIKELLGNTDVLITAIKKYGQPTPLLLTRKELKIMQNKSVIIDLSIDQGGCLETSRPTMHDNPVFVQDNIIHYCVPNIPSAVPHTSSRVLSAAALPYIKQIASMGFEEAISISNELRQGLSIYRGKTVHPQIAKIHGHEYYPILELLELNI